MIFVGTAGWSIPRASASQFQGEGTHLERYAHHLPCTEINSSFHRPHAAATYLKWAAATPRGFRFAVKVPREITHDLKLRRARRPLDRFLEEAGGLANKRGPLLVQLPPSLHFDDRVANRFFELLRSLDEGSVVCEPRHETWFTSRADSLLCRYRVARVAADPAPAIGADRPGGWGGMVYFRLHGAPRKYWSRYDNPDIVTLASRLQGFAASAPTWCVFDNTASGAALENACELFALLRSCRVHG